MSSITVAAGIAVIFRENRSVLCHIWVPLGILVLLVFGPNLGSSQTMTNISDSERFQRVSQRICQYRWYSRSEGEEMKILIIIGVISALYAWFLLRIASYPAPTRRLLKGRQSQQKENQSNDLQQNSYSEHQPASWRHSAVFEENFRDSGRGLSSDQNIRNFLSTQQLGPVSRIQERICGF